MCDVFAIYVEAHVILIMTIMLRHVVLVRFLRIMQHFYWDIEIIFVISD